MLWGYAILCPDLPDGEGLLLKGSPASLHQKNFSFSVKKCKNKPNCKTEKEIDEWMQDI